MSHPTARPGPAIRLTLQAEGLALGAFCITVYGLMGGGWGLFALLILAPDLFMLGYLAGRRPGALCYNLGHSTLAPFALAGLSEWADWRAGMLLALIWGAHIGIDRALGYGLKLGSGFRDSHLSGV